MSFNKDPKQVLPTINATGGNLIINLSELTQPLTEAEANSDWRNILFSLIDHFADYYIGLADDDRPDKVEIFKSGRLDGKKTLEHTYTITVSTSIVAEDVAAE
jgi:hypothetical protein